MNLFIEIILLSFCSYIVSRLLTKYSIVVLPKLGFIDKPKKLHLHESPTPLSGGIAIFSPLLLIYIYDVVAFYFMPELLISSTLNIFSLIKFPVTILLITGLIDDRYELRSSIKLIIQIFIACLCFYKGIRIDYIFGFKLPEYICLVLTVLWIVTFINALNMIDGIDGLAAGIGGFSLLTLGIIFLINQQNGDAVLSFVLSASCLGFLAYNFNPAKIFMGDTGSMFIGFMVAVMGIKYFGNSQFKVSVFVPMFASGIPVLDIILAIWRRTVKKFHHKLSQEQKTKRSESDIKVMGRDMWHIHHRTLYEFKSPKETVLRLYNLSIIGSLIAIVCATLNDAIDSIVIIVALITVAVIFVKTCSKEVKETKNLIKWLHYSKKVYYKYFLLALIIHLLLLVGLVVLTGFIVTLDIPLVNKMIMSVIPYFIFDLVSQLIVIQNIHKEKYIINSFITRVKYFSISFMFALYFYRIQCNLPSWRIFLFQALYFIMVILFFSLAQRFTLMSTIELLRKRKRVSK